MSDMIWIIGKVYREDSMIWTIHVPQQASGQELWYLKSIPVVQSYSENFEARRNITDNFTKTRFEFFMSNSELSVYSFDITVPDRWLVVAHEPPKSLNLPLV